MNKEFKKRIQTMFPFDETHRAMILDAVSIKEAAAGAILLREGETASQLFFVIKGCLRTYFIKDTGVEITSQFFIENQMVTSFESAMTGIPSRQYIEAIEDTIVASIPVKRLKKIIKDHEQVRNYFTGYIMMRLALYMNQFASFILDNPEKRYQKFAQENPPLISRIPQQYIASYLGITPVSLSRIKNRLRKKN